MVNELTEFLKANGAKPCFHKQTTLESSVPVFGNTEDDQPKVIGMNNTIKCIECELEWVEYEKTPITIDPKHHELCLIQDAMECSCEYIGQIAHYYIDKYVFFSQDLRDQIK